LSVEARWALLRQWGDFSLAYSTAVQPILKYFGDADGYIAYATRWRQTYVLADPVTSPTNAGPLIDRFLQNHPASTFVEISEPTAALLAQRGYWINEMGVDTRLDLPTYDFRGKEKERFRYGANWLASHGYRVVDDAAEPLANEEMVAVTTAWRATRPTRREVIFLNRPICYHREPDVRRFGLRDPDGKLIAFAVFDPIYRAGGVIGYVTSFKQRVPDAPGYAETGMMKVIIERLQSDGVAFLRLGLSPLAAIEDRQFRANPLLRFSFRCAYRAGWVNRFLYNMQGHAAMKRRFGGVEEKAYFASPALFNDWRIAALLKLIRIY